MGEIGHHLAADQIDRLLTFLHLCESDSYGKHKVQLARMDGAIPLCIANAKTAGSSEILFPHNNGLPAVWPIRTVMVFDAVTKEEDPDGHPVGTLSFRAIRTIRTAEARKIGATKFSPHMLMDEIAYAKPDGSALTARAAHVLLGGKWRLCSAKMRDPEEIERAVPLAVGAALTVRYEWTVWLGYEQGPRVRIFSDPRGAMEVFRLRDLPNGRMRRAALRNWVTAHSRRRADPEAEMWVKRHLRGAQDFNWNGLRCRVEPPAFDLEQLARAG